MKHKFAFVLAAVILTAGMSSPIFSGEKLTVQADYAAFYNREQGSAYIEFYYGLYRRELGFIGADTIDFRYAGVLATVHLFDEQGVRVDSISTYFLSRIDDAIGKEQTNIRLFDYLPLKAAPGSYRAAISVIDDVSKKSGNAELKVIVPEFDDGNLTASDLELAYEIRDVGETAEPSVNTRLVKEGRLVVPNPIGLYLAGVDSSMFVYSELYGLDVSGSAAEGFTVNYLIKDSLGNLVHEFGENKYDKPGPSAVLSNELDVSNLEPGGYFLSQEAVDLFTRQSTVTIKPFSLIGPAAAKEVNPADAQLMVDIAWYHLSEAEKIQVQKLGPGAKKNFIKQFWRRVDDDPSTPENLFYNSAVRRYIFANDHFSLRQDPAGGWKSDRGRVYIMYGPYDDEMEVPLPGTTDPLIKWDYYNLEGGVIFIFASDAMAGGVDYRLVHSTHPREKYNAAWERRLADEAPEEFWDHGDQ